MTISCPLHQPLPGLHPPLLHTTLQSHSFPISTASHEIPSPKNILGSIMLICTLSSPISGKTLPFQRNFFFLIFIYSIAPDLSCSRRAPQLQLVGSVVVARELLVVACMWNLVP